MSCQCKNKDNSKDTDFEENKFENYDEEDYTKEEQCHKQEQNHRHNQYPGTNNECYSEQYSSKYQPMTRSANPVVCKLYEVPFCQDTRKGEQCYKPIRDLYSDERYKCNKDVCEDKPLVLQHRSNNHSKEMECNRLMDIGKPHGLANSRIHHPKGSEDGGTKGFLQTQRSPQSLDVNPPNKCEPTQHKDISVETNLGDYINKLLNMSRRSIENMSISGCPCSSSCTYIDRTKLQTISQSEYIQKLLIMTKKSIEDLSVLGSELASSPSINSENKKIDPCKDQDYKQKTSNPPLSEVTRDVQATDKAMSLMNHVVKLLKDYALRISDMVNSEEPDEEKCPSLKQHLDLPELLGPDTLQNLCQTKFSVPIIESLSVPRPRRTPSIYSGQSLVTCKQRKQGQQSEANPLKVMTDGAQKTIKTTFGLSSNLLPNSAHGCARPLAKPQLQLSRISECSEVTSQSSDSPRNQMDQEGVGKSPN